jgi:hypothetical protein
MCRFSQQNTFALPKPGKQSEFSLVLAEKWVEQREINVRDTHSGQLSITVNQPLKEKHHNRFIYHG